MKEGKVVLVTGATGKVGQNFIRRFVADPAWQDAKIRAFCHNRLLEEGERLGVVQGSMAERGDVAMVEKELVMASPWSWVSLGRSILQAASSWAAAFASAPSRLQVITMCEAWGAIRLTCS